MQFDHHNMTGVHLAVALVNLGESWDRVALQHLLQEHWIRTAGLTESECGELRGLAGRLRPVFEATSVEVCCHTINALLIGRGSAFLAIHDDLPPHLHFAAHDDELVNRVSAFTAGSLAMFTVEAAGRRLGACGRAGCRTVFVDTSRSGRRTYCSARCANNDAVERHRQRKHSVPS